MKNIKNTFFILLFFAFSSINAQIPAGYYDSANGLTGAELKTALYNIIKDHNADSYTGLWTDFQKTDVKSNGKVWDMYSDIPGSTPPYEYTFGSDQCGSYSGEGSCYNREHSFPKSWFNDATPMYTDLFHIVPTDGYVNGKRSNYPFGEVSSPTWTSQNGSKLGPCSYSGYTGTVFEPIDDYKGDFARNYFYMATRYENLIASWETNSTESDAVLNGTSYPCFETWFINLLTEWDSNDPVSQKEINRNDSIYTIQGNRNPYIDHPEYVGYVWGNSSPSGSPSITNIIKSPASPTENDAVSVSADITDDGSISAVSLKWGTDGNNFPNSISMTLQTGNTYTTSSDIPVQTANTTVYYFISATDNESNTTNSDTVNYTVSSSGGGGTEHWSEGFEDQTATGYVSEFTCTNSGTWTASQAGNFTLGTARTGSKCVAINDDKANAHITTPSLNTVGNVSFYYYQRNGDANDVFQLQKSVNGGTFENIGSVTSFNVGETYTLFSYDVNETSTNTKLRVLSDNNAGHLIIDDFTVTGFTGTSVDNPTSFSATTISASEIDLSWALNAANNSVILAFNSSNTFGTPTEGQSYNADDVISGGGTVIYNGNSTTYNHTGLTGGTQYFYKIWSFDNNNKYSTGETTNNTTVKAEPTNHVTNFTNNTITSSSIELTWTGATGTILPDNYLIVSKTGTGTFLTVTDGSAIPDDNDWSDNITAVNITHTDGTNTYTFNGLNANTSYSFKIYSYTNSGSNIDYKTDGTIPSITVSTNEQAASQTETFDNFTETGTSYVDGTFTGVDGSIWNYVQCRGDQQITGSTPCLGKGRTPTSEVYSGTISGGIGTLSFDYKKPFSTSVNLDVFINDQLVSNITTSETTVQNTGDISINVTGDFVIKFKQNSSSSGQVSIDNVTWTSYSTNSCTPPSSQAASLTFDNISHDTLTVSWVRGNGNKVLLVAKEGSAVNTDPVSGTAYSDSTKFGKGSEIGTGNYVIYDGTGTSINLTGLSSSTTYYFAVYEYNTLDTCYNTAELSGNVTTSSWPIPSSYYSNAEGKTCDELKTALYNIIKGHTEYPYTSDNTDVWDILKNTDEDPDNSNNVILLYSGRSQDKEFYNRGETYDYSQWGVYDDCWEREHVWAKSHGDFGTTMGPGTDVHHLRPVDRTMNSEKYSKDLDNGGTEIQEGGSGSGCFTDNDSFEPRDDVKGDVARMIFYMATRYEGENGEPDLEINDQTENYPNPYFGKLSVLLQWNEDDPVSDWERQRNDKIYNDYQHNRNPFIDHPEYVALIWNDTCPAPPVISNIVTSPTLPDIYSPVNIYADITDEGTIVSAKLLWNTDSTSLDSIISMSINSGNNYKTINGIPVQEIGTKVYYKIRAIDDDSDTTFSNIYSYTISSSVTILSEDFTTCPSQSWTIINVNNDDKEWTCSSNAMNVNGYGATPSGSLSDDWIISPAVNLNNYDNEILTFETAVQYTGPDLSLKYSINYSGSGDPNNADWTSLSYTKATTSSFTSSGDIDVSSITGSTVYFAFLYTSTGTSSGEAASWSVDNILLKGDSLGICTPPSTQATNFSTSNITSTSATINFTRGDGDKIIVIAKKANYVDANPQNGSSYTANSSFSSGSELGVGNFVVFNGTDNSFSITNLEQNTLYYIALYEYNTTELCYKSNPLTGSFTTSEDPKITIQPVNTQVCLDDGVTFSVSVEGTETISYQWNKDGTAITGATTNSYTITAASLSDTGTYFCSISNTLNSINSDTVSLTVISVDKPTATDTAICYNQTVPALQAVGNDIKWYSDSNLSTQVGSGNTYITGQTLPDTYNYYVTQTENGCTSDADTATIEIYELPVANAGDDVSITYGSSTILNGSVTGGFGNYSYSWSPADSLINSNIANPQTVNLKSSTTFTLTVTDQHLCFDDDNMLVTVTGGAISVSINYDKTTICVGDSVNLTAIASGGTGNYTYSWTSGPTGFVSSDANAVFKPIENTMFKVLINDGNSSDSADIAITVNSIPDAPVADDITVCYGDIVPEFTSTGTNISWYSDSGLNNLIASGNYFSSNETNAGTYNYYITQTVNNCESLTDTASLTIISAPNVNVGVDTSICSGNSYTITNANASNYSSLLWSTAGDGSFSDAATITPIYTPGTSDIANGSVILTLNADGNGNCSQVSDDLTLTLISEPIVNAGADTSICSGNSYTITNANASNYSSLLWSTAGDGSFSDAATITPIYTPGTSDIANGSVILTLNANGNGNCNATSNNFLLSITPQPEIPEANDVTICFGDTIPALYATGENINWFSDSELSNLINDENYFITNETEVGVYTYYVTQTISECQSEATIVQLSINEKPEPPVTYGVTGCEGTVLNNLQADGNNINWYQNADLTDIIETGNEFSSNETVHGTYTYYATQTVGECESEAASVDLVIYPQPNPPVGKDTSACSNEEYFEVYAEGENINWYVDSDLTELIGSGNTYDTSNLDVGIHYFYAVQLSEECTSLPDTVKLTIYEIPDKPFSMDVETCIGDEPVYLVATGTNIQWFNTIDLSNLLVENDTLVPNVSDAGINTFYVTQSINNCQSEPLEVLLTIKPLPVANFNYSINLLEVTFENLSENFDSILWNFGDETISTELNPVHQYYPGYYNVVLTAFSNTCGIDSTDTTITVLDSYGIDINNEIIQNIYPNPFDEYFIVETNQNLNRIELTDITGKIIKQINNPQKGYNHIFTKNLDKGLYLIRVYTKENLILTYKLFK